MTFLSQSVPGSEQCKHVTSKLNWSCSFRQIHTSIILFILVYIWSLPATANDKTGIWMKYEKEFTSEVTYKNPLYDVKEFKITFTAPSGKQFTINGFWDGGNKWKVRFMPDETGEWTFTSRCSDKSNTGLHEINGSFLCIPHKNEQSIYKHGRIGQPDGTYHMTYADGTPFFWTGCTAWNGALKSSPDEWETYLEDRVEKNFSVIQFVTTQWRGCESDRNGQVAFTGSGKINIHPEFFQRLDKKVDRINEHGLVAAPVLLWALPSVRGRHMSPGYYLPQDEAILLARYMVARYGGHHVVWILGGDGRYVNEYEQRWKNIGRGVFGNEHPGIVAQHPHGRSWIGTDYSSEDWLDIAGYQSSHSTSARTVNWVNTGPPAQEWDRIAPRAIMNMEPIYEQIHEKTTATDVRQAMYWSLFTTPISGITYGANGIWPWLREGEKILNHNDAPWTSTWDKSLDLPGGWQTSYLSEFIQQFDWWKFRPAHEILLVHQPGKDQYNHFISMVRSPDHKIIMGYIPQKRTFEIYNPERKKYQLQWFDPVRNQYSEMKNLDFSQDGVIELTSPGEGDRVFVLREK